MGDFRLMVLPNMTHIVAYNDLFDESDVKKSVRFADLLSKLLKEMPEEI